MDTPAVPADLWIEKLARDLAETAKRATFWEAAYQTKAAELEALKAKGDKP